LAARLAEELLALVPTGRGPVLIKEVGEDLSWYWSSDVRTTREAIAAAWVATPSLRGSRR
jgi:hypothetical protein